MKKIIVDESAAGQRFDRFLRKYFKHTPEIRLGDIFSWLRKWSIKVNKKKRKQDYRLQVWDEITRDPRIHTNKKADKVLKKKQAKIADLSLEELQQSLVAEDDHFLIWNKSAHLLMHPWDKHLTDITLHDMMVSYLMQTWQWNATQTYSPSFCYRLDKDTSGIVISAKTYEALQYLNQAIRERKTQKIYHTILVWDLNYLKQNLPWHVIKSHISHEVKRISITAPLFVWYNRNSWRSQTFINQERGKESRTDLHLVKTVRHPELWTLSLVQVKLYTWRMHQIRAHCAYIWMPVVWDLTYGIPALNRKASKQWVTRQLLHASSYWFFDQFKDKDVSFTTWLPSEFSNLIDL